ncbi:unnamed protein product, partial [Mesorhabditis spiculigera]
MPVFHTKTIENILEPVAQQLHYVVAVAEACARQGPRPEEPPVAPPGALSRASSRRSLRSELVAPDTLRTLVTDEDCPVCHLMLPKGGGGIGCVSRLVILHEEAEDGGAMPDLTRPVGLVSHAVDNLIKVGYDTCDHSDDRILQQDMPPALQRVEGSSRLLEDACRNLKGDPYSAPGRQKLIEGARGILQGTSALLLCFDESEVRKIIRGCRKVLDYLAVSEVIESLDDLTQFVKDITPWLSRVSQDVNLRQQELTHQVHREILLRCLDQIKTLSPILICSMKIFIQLGQSPGSRGQQEAAENRNYLAQRMTDEMNEVIRVLQLTTYDEDEWDADNVTVMRKALSAAKSLLAAALEWLADPRGVPGSVGEKAIRRICEYAERIATRALPEDAYVIQRATSEIHQLTDSICQLRNQGRDDERLTQQCAQKLRDLVGTKASSGLLPEALTNAHKAGVGHPAHTAAGRLEQALRWLDNPGVDDGGLGLRAIKMMTDDARKLADQLNPQDRGRLLGLCSDIDRLAGQLADLERRGLGNSPEAHAIRQQLRDKLRELADFMRRILTDRVVEHYADITTPLKQFVEAARADYSVQNREYNFQDKSTNLREHSGRMTSTARLVASCGPCKNKKTVEAIIDQMTPQLVNAGKIRLHNDTDAIDQHFENLHRQYADALHRLRSHVDDAIDTGEFVRASEGAMRKYTDHCEHAISSAHPQSMVDNTSQIARLGNRVLMTAKNEADNSEDPHFVRRVNDAASSLHSGSRGPSSHLDPEDPTESLAPHPNRSMPPTFASGFYYPRSEPNLTEVGFAKERYSEERRRQDEVREERLFEQRRVNYEQRRSQLDLYQLRDFSPSRTPPKYYSYSVSRGNSRATSRGESRSVSPEKVPKFPILSREGSRHSSPGRRYQSNSYHEFQESRPRSVAVQSTGQLHESRGHASRRDYGTWGSRHTSRTIPPMVNHAKSVAMNPRDGGAANHWRGANDHLLDSVRAVGDAITGVQAPPSRNNYHQETIRSTQPSPARHESSQNFHSVQAQPPPQPTIHHKMIVREEIPPPPRPPPPVEISPPPRPPPPPVDEEEEETRAFWERYPLPGGHSQPMLSAAHNLHNELKQWSSHENEIVAAAKRMAILMARLSQLVRGEGGTKKDLIDCAKAIADSSEEVTRLAVQLARQCTDIKMRMTLLQVCERIPTIATQLKILSTVKATMLGSAATIGPYGQPIDGSEEDEEAMQQLCLNAQNLMQSVKDTVRAAEAASIKIRTNSGLRLRWIRKPMWSNF